MGSAHICVAITAKDVKSAKEEAGRAMQLGATLIEHRIDFLKNLDHAKVKELLEGRDYPVILTNRRKEEGGHFQGEDEAERISLLICALNMGKFRPEYIDVELESLEDFRDYALTGAKFCGSKSIISTHFMKYTPDLDELMAIYDISTETKADIIKIATFAQTPADNDIIYKLIEKTKGGIPLIAIAMGKIGSETRIKSVQMGTFLTFASLEEGKESASGQIPIGEMIKELV